MSLSPSILQAHPPTEAHNCQRMAVPSLPARLASPSRTDRPIHYRTDWPIHSGPMGLPTAEPTGPSTTGPTGPFTTGPIGLFTPDPRLLRSNFRCRISKPKIASAKRWVPSEEANRSGSEWASRSGGGWSSRFGSGEAHRSRVNRPIGPGVKRPFGPGVNGLPFSDYLEPRLVNRSGSE